MWQKGIFTIMASLRNSTVRPLFYLFFKIFPKSCKTFLTKILKSLAENFWKLSQNIFPKFFYKRCRIFFEIFVFLEVIFASRRKKKKHKTQKNAWSTDPTWQVLLPIKHSFLCVLLSSCIKFLSWRRPLKKMEHPKTFNEVTQIKKNLLQCFFFGIGINISKYHVRTRNNNITYVRNIITYST